MFKFDFKVDVDAHENTIFESDCADNSFSKIEASNECYESEEILPDSQILNNLDVYRLNSTIITIGKVKLRHVLTGAIIQNKAVDDNVLTAIRKAEDSHADLIPGVYEGGAKTWECTDDLLLYLSKNYTNSFWQNKQVLDLGCGTGLLGIYAMKCQAGNVHFQDYNKEVLTTITIPNVLLNRSDCKCASKFYCGDWSKFAQFTESNEKFDILVTSETIYNPANQQKLLDVIYSKMKNDGLVFVAAKSYYFGVGGSLRQFEDVIAADGRFISKSVWKSKDNVSREILQLSIAFA